MAKFIKVTRKGTDGVKKSVVVRVGRIDQVFSSVNGGTVIEIEGKWDSGETKYQRQIDRIVETPEEIYALIKEAQGAGEVESEIDIDLSDAISMAIESGEVDPGDILQMVKDAVK